MSIYTCVIRRTEDPYPIVHLLYNDDLWLMQSMSVSARDPNNGSSNIMIKSVVRRAVC